MKPDANARISLRTPLTAAALSLLIVACGGGGNSDNARNVSSSPTPGSATSNPSASTNPATGGSNTGTGGSNTGTGNSATAPSNTNINITTGAFVGSGAIAEAITGGTPPTPPATDNGNQSSSTTPSTGNGNTSAGGASNTGSTGSGNTADAGAAADSNTGSTTPTTPAVVPLVSDQGVRGDVLLAMFDQHACASPYESARAESLSSPNSDRLGKTVDTPTLRSLAFIEKNPYVYGYTPYTYDYSKWEAHGDNSARARVGWVLQCEYPDIRTYTNPLQPGNYTFSMETGGVYKTSTYSSYWGAEWITKGINTARSDYAITATENEFTIGSTATLYLDEDLDYQATSVPFHM